jgi:hypothetical protein
VPGPYSQLLILNIFRVEVDGSLVMMALMHVFLSRGLIFKIYLVRCLQILSELASLMLCIAAVLMGLV